MFRSQTIRNLTRALIFSSTLIFAASVHAAILWSDSGPALARNTGEGVDILHGAAKEDDSSANTLYFKFTVDPLSDVSSEEYFAAFQLYEGDAGRLAVGNSLKAWAYSAFNTAETGTNNTVTGDMDLHSARPEVYEIGEVRHYELPRRGIPCTIVFKVQFIPHSDDLVTVWIDPNLAKGATEQNQPANLTTRFRANASFDEIRLRHGGLGGGWIFRDMAIATTFNDFVVVHFWQTWWFFGLIALVFAAGMVAAATIAERKKFQRRLQRAEKEHALERERTRIAQDLHDDLGSLLTRISLLSGLLRADRDNPGQVEIHANKISQSADQTVRALEEIVWAVRPGSDSLQSLVEYIAHFANELFEGNATRCRLDLPHDLPAQSLPPDVRHNFFLIVKEALTNALKHAGAGEVRVRAQVAADTLEFFIEDDGKGFEHPPADERRHGLGNMRHRAEAIGGILEWQTAPGKGTVVHLKLKLKSRGL